jgi:hypothetical protein
LKIGRQAGGDSEPWFVAHKISENELTVVQNHDIPLLRDTQNRGTLIPEQIRTRIGSMSRTRYADDAACNLDGCARKALIELPSRSGRQRRGSTPSSTNRRYASAEA